MHAGERLSLEQIQAFLEGSDGVQFDAENRRELYEWVNQTMREQGYDRLGRRARGMIRRYVAKMTGMSRAQVTRLIGLYLEGGEVKVRGYRRRRFPSHFKTADIELLAVVDEAHEILSGPATQKILQREYYDFGDQRYVRLATISVAHIYNLRRTRTYRERRIRYAVTKPTQVAIGERRAPQPEGRPGYLRVDTVHQGDEEGIKGVYHINAVDEVTQWQVVGATPQISEAWLIPVLKAILAQFPFRIHGFHSDNGSEFINHTVAKLLNKLLIEQTKSRPRRSNDNGLVESKNGAVIRKHMGYVHIAADHAQSIEEFYEQHLNPYLNFHRPCGQPEMVATGKGKLKRVYRWYATPWETLRRLPGIAGYLTPDFTIQALDQRARANSDTQAAIEMREAKCKLFASFQRRRSA